VFFCTKSVDRRMVEITPSDRSAVQAYGVPHRPRRASCEDLRISARSRQKFRRSGPVAREANRRSTLLTERSGICHCARITAYQPTPAASSSSHHSHAGTFPTGRAGALEALLLMLVYERPDPGNPIVVRVPRLPYVVQKPRRPIDVLMPDLLMFRRTPGRIEMRRRKRKLTIYRTT